MPSLDLLRRHQVATAAVIGLLLGGIIGLFLPIRAAAPPKVSSEAWVLPAIGDTKRFREDAYMALRSARFWKSVAVPGQQGAPKVEWTLTAIITRPQPMAAIERPGTVRSGNSNDNMPSTLVTVGAELPDGSTLVRLTRDAVWFEKDGCLRERRLYRAVTAENNACIGETGAASTDPAGSAQTSTPKPSAPNTSTPNASTPNASTPNASKARPASPAAVSPQSGSDLARPTPTARTATP